jgi:hypothetical protein
VLLSFKLSVYYFLCRLLFIFLSFFIWPLCCLIFEIRYLIYLDGIFKMISIIFFLASPVKVVSVIAEGNNLSKKEKIHCHLRYGYIVTANHIVRTTVKYIISYSRKHILPAYGVYSSQLIRYSRACAQYSDFLDRTLLLTQKLLKQGYLISRLFKVIATKPLRSS